MKILRSDKRIHCLFHYTYTLHSEILQKRVIFFEVFACLTRQNQTEISFFKQVLYPSSYLKIHPPKHPTTLMPRAKCFWAFSPRANRNRTMPIPPENMGVQKQFRYFVENARTQNQAKKQGVFAFIVVSLPFETIKTLLDNGKSKRLRIQFSVDSLQWSS